MSVRIINSDALSALRTLPEKSVQACVTSPPYFQLRDYGCEGQIGLERTPAAFLDALYAVFDEVRRVMRDDAVLFVNLGDSYAGSGKGPTTSASTLGAGRGVKGHEKVVKRTAQLRQGFHDEHKYTGMPSKSLLLIPERFAIGMADRGWIVRSRMPWLKANCMPESVRDRPVSAIEWVFMFAKQGAYYWDAEAVRKAFADDRMGRDGSKLPREINRGGRKDGFTKPNGIDPSANGGRSFRNSDLFWSHVDAIKAGNGLLLDEDGDPLALLVNPKPSGLEHFAAYPDTLVEPLIRAATSEKGGCPACGAPWARVVERERGTPATEVRGYQAGVTGTTPKVTHGKGSPNAVVGANYMQMTPRGGVRSETTGWAPTCRCVDAGPPVPQVVLDPFAGSFTTSLTAERLGRDSIGIELNPAYVELGRRRLYGDCPMFADIEVSA